MKKILLLVLILPVLIGIALIIAVVVGAMVGKHPLEKKQNDVIAATPPPVADADSPWLDYLDGQQGFSLKIPKLVTLEQSECAPAGSNNKIFTYEVPTTVLKDGDKTYIAVAYRMGKDAEATEADDCHRIESTLDDIRAFYAATGGSFIGWRVTIVPVSDQAALEAYVKTLFDHTCKIDKMTKNAAGQFDVTLTGLDPKDSEQCFIDSEIYFKYSETQKKLAVLEGAQDCVFPDAILQAPASVNQSADDAFYNQHCYDHDLVASFKFE
jgi:hypothetical protein